MKKNSAFFMGNKLVLNDLWAETCLSCLDRAYTLCGPSEIYNRLTEALLYGNFSQLTVDKSSSATYVFSIHNFKFVLFHNEARSTAEIKLSAPIDSAFGVEPKFFFNSFINTFSELLAVCYSKNFNLLERTHYES